MKLRHIGEEELMELIKAIFSLASSLRIWKVSKIYSLVSLGLKIKPLLQGLDSQSCETKAENILEALKLVAMYRKSHKEEFEDILDSVFEIAENKREEALKIAKGFCKD